MTAMAITPDEIETNVFPLVRRGYDPMAVDDFLKEVADTLSQAQGGLATPPVAEAPAPEAPAPVQPDGYNQLGEEVAAILRQAHESVEELRHRAEADAALIRQNAQREADELTRRADADRQAAAIELEAARGESDRILGDVQRRADGAAGAVTAMAREATREVIEAARAEARGAVIVQRNVRGRLEDARDRIGPGPRPPHRGGHRPLRHHRPHRRRPGRGRRGRRRRLGAAPGPGSPSASWPPARGPHDAHRPHGPALRRRVR